MSERERPATAGLLVREDQGLVGIVVGENGRQATRFFVDEAVDEFDRIRHESTPTPPLDL